MVETAMRTFCDASRPVIRYIFISFASGKKFMTRKHESLATMRAQTPYKHGTNK